MSFRPIRFVFALLFVVMATPGIACSQDARENNTPTDWTAMFMMDVAGIQKKRAEGYRIVQLDTTTWKPTFHVTFVRNRGEYYRRGATWYYGTASFIASKLSGRRIIDLEPYEYRGQLYFAASMVANTGSQYKKWAWYYGTAAFISSKLNGRRIVDLDSYRLNGNVYYSAVMIANTGADRRDWWWYTNKTKSYIIGRSIALRARIRDVERVGMFYADEYCALLTRHPSQPKPSGAWYTWKTWNEVREILKNDRSRAVKIESVGKGLCHLLTLDNRGTIEEFGASCSGKSGIPRHTVGGSPMRGKNLYFRLTNGPRSSPVLFLIGGSNTSWGGHTKLPLSMTGLGAPGCRLYVDPTIPVAGSTNSSGYKSFKVTVPNGDHVGAAAFTQFLCADPGWNALGTIATNGVETRIGQ